MQADDFRRIALSLPEAEAGTHMGAEDFRTGGHIFATLAHVGQGFGNLMLTPQLQAEFVAAAPELFQPVPGGWGRMGATHMVLALADEAQLRGALVSAHKRRTLKNAKQKGGNPRKRAAAS